MGWRGKWFKSGLGELRERGLKWLRVFGKWVGNVGSGPARLGFLVMRE